MKTFNVMFIQAEDSIRESVFSDIEGEFVQVLPEEGDEDVIPREYRIMPMTKDDFRAILEQICFFEEDACPGIEDIFAKEDDAEFVQSFNNFMMEADLADEYAPGAYVRILPEGEERPLTEAVLHGFTWGDPDLGASE